MRITISVFFVVVLATAIPAVAGASGGADGATVEAGLVLEAPAPGAVVTGAAHLTVSATGASGEETIEVRVLVAGEVVGARQVATEPDPVGEGRWRWQAPLDTTGWPDGEVKLQVRAANLRGGGCDGVEPVALCEWTGHTIVLDLEPTEEPTEQPAEEPTEQPAEQPTEEPTEEPAEELTEEPTEQPAGEPTEEPTQPPTQPPTEQPAEEPTGQPTQPTQEPAEPEDSSEFDDQPVRRPRLQPLQRTGEQSTGPGGDDSSNGGSGSGGGSATPTPSRSPSLSPRTTTRPSFTSTPNLRNRPPAAVDPEDSDFDWDPPAPEVAGPEFDVEQFDDVPPPEVAPPEVAALEHVTEDDDGTEGSLAAERFGPIGPGSVDVALLFWVALLAAAHQRMIGRRRIGRA